MGTLTGKVALVTGASRGVGKGIALVLGEACATVYVTGRTVDEAQAAVPLTGTVQQTADEVTRLGGKGVAVRCDHRDDAQVEAAFKKVWKADKQLDILVNNAWAGYEGYHKNTYFAPNHPFWKKAVAYWDANLDGVRWAYVASHIAARKMTKQGSGLIVNISFGVPEPGNPAYGVAKTATDRMTWDMAAELRKYNIAVVALYPGLVRTEGVILNAKYFDMTKSESPQFTGRAVAALAADPNIMEKTGKALVVAELAQEYDFNDIDGTRLKPV